MNWRSKGRLESCMKRKELKGAATRILHQLGDAIEGERVAALSERAQLQRQAALEGNISRQRDGGILVQHHILVVRPTIDRD